MIRTLACAWALMLLCLLAPLGAQAVDPPHYDPANGFTCANCHISQLIQGNAGFNNTCLSCHRPGNPAAGSNPFTLADAADPFRLHSSVGGRQFQTSHRWDGPDTVPQAGALPPIQGDMTTNTLRQRSGNQLACVRCHNQHYEVNKPYLRVANDQDQLCLDCHRVRNVASHLKGSHPVGVSYTQTATGNPGFNPLPVNANPANPSSDLASHLGSGGTVLCTTCHGVHYADSRSSTPDGAAGFANLSTGDGFLLRTDPRGPKVAAGQPDGANLCTNCHAGKRNHNAKGQDIQCLDCHAAHVEYDPNDPTGSKGTNVFLVRRNLNRPGALPQVFFRYTGSAREYVNSTGTGVCQGCHTVPPPGGIYPPEHASQDPRVCNTCHFHNNPAGSFSGSCAACHGFPPTTTALGGSSGLAAPATNALGSAPASAGAHAAHVTSQGMTCLACHNGYSGKAMPSSTIDMGFSVDGTTFPGFAGSASGGSFTGTSGLSSGYSWSGAPGTTVTTSAGAAPSCTVYCHGSTLTGGSNAAPSWTGGTAQASCGSCHGASSAAPPTTGGHQHHAGASNLMAPLACSTCHPNPGAPGHVNGSVSWDVSALPSSGGPAQYRGAASGSTGAVAPSASYGQCSNVYCHGGKTMTWGGPALPADCSGCHGGLATGPDYANGTPKANSHAKHVVVNGLACALCHSSVVDASGAIVNKTLHINQAYDVAAGGTASFSVTVTGSATAPTQCSNISCHGGTGTSATWGQALNCQDCHGAASDLDNFNGTFWNNGVIAKIGTTEWTSTGHGASAPYRSGNPGANFGRNGNLRQCEFCHDSSVGHKLAGNPFRLLNYSSAAWGRNQVCQSCHATGAAGVTVAGTLITSTLKIGSVHLGAKHGVANNGGQFCWDCHDAHGDANDYMLHSQVAAASDRTTGAPTTAVPVSFTLATPGKTAWSDFVKPAFNGICQVCHTATGAGAVNHFTSTSFDANHNPGSACTVCHNHSGTTTATGFQPSGSCNTCHGYPPAPRKVTTAVVFGVQGSWSSARFEDYSGGGGAHILAAHIAKNAQPSQGWTNCLPCHNGGPAAHATSLPLNGHVENVTVRVDPQYRFSDDVLPAYTSAKLTSGGTNRTGSCFNVACHFTSTPKWSIER